jgi:hypothetical protein
MSYLFCVSLAGVFANPLSETATPETRALAYLAREVPRWSSENKCYSCHHNGDAARALYRAVQLSYPVPAKALDDTSRWLDQPQQWDHNKGDPAFSDKGLARIQFAAALVAALEAGSIKDRQALTQAAELVADGQRKNGSWKVDEEGNAGSPATYGACLATYQARQVLQKADPRRYQTAIERADQWFRTVPVTTVLDAAAVRLALEGKAGPGVVEQRKTCLALMRKGESPRGGWGPYVNSAAEPFDTAVVVLALSRQADQPDVKPLLQRGRAYLVRTQRGDGSWPETTRPAGGESYAQRLSTTGWATLALLTTQAPR